MKYIGKSNFIGQIPDQLLNEANCYQVSLLLQMIYSSNCKILAKKFG